MRWNRSLNAFLANYFGFIRESFQGIMTQAGNILGDQLYIVFPDRYVKLQRLLQEWACETETRAVVRLSSYIDKKFKSYLIIPNGSFSDEDSYVKSAVIAHTLYRRSSVWTDFTFAFVLSCPANLKSALNHRAVKRGLWAVKSGVGVKSNSEDDLLKYVQQSENLSAFEVFFEAESKSTCIFQAVSEKDGGKGFQFHIEITSNENEASRIFNNPNFSPVFHSYEEARYILQKCCDMPDVKELLEIADRNILADFKKQSAEMSLKHPFVVVEGLDATGKTTLTKILEDKLGAARYYTPPPLVQHLRQFFDTLPEIVRRAYYSVGNYLVAMEIAKECQTRPVIMDRYWHSTAAYGIANESSTADLPELGHMVYNWPKDLLRPSVVLFLSVTEEVRRQRLSGRGEETTFEEKHLDRDKLFRQRLCEAYRRMVDPSCIEINACGSVESVVEAALEVLNKHDISFSQKT
ncbi:hypothetical protein CHS0354_040216 [Potamilus streckersoni]|uniref:Thymidylate kinase-like domain-containing protein n=1 Tax=Potamilus streckersoni TaxID=2493646 RepID=A0AAE0VUI1_9BIVA|nr:hypothetical protein CHS0354_040216 [Potamilus streckersoni]